jgi:tetratricopeptide (TPR) repeat protein
MRIALLLTLLLALPVIAAEDPRIAEGTALHDAGRYDEAIAKYQAVLADDPHNDLASYELGYTYQTKGDFAKCRALLEPLTTTERPLLGPMLQTLGSCLDGAGDAQAAVAAYRKSLALTPNDPLTLYNLGITLIGQGKLDEARDVLKLELALRPGHPSGHYALARVFEAQSFRAPAVLEYLRYLAVEPSASRSKGAATNLLALLNQGVADKGAGKDGKKNITLMIDPDSRKEEGDFSGWETGMALVSGTRFIDDDKEKKKLSEFERAQSQLTTTLVMLLEMKDAPKTYSGSRNVPFFATLSNRKLLDAFAAVALSSLNLKGTEDWMKQNTKSVDEFKAFMASQR